MAGLARVWLALAGLVAGVLCAGATGTPALLAAAAAALPLSARRRGVGRAVAVFVLAFAFGAVNAQVRSPQRQPVASLARAVPSCEVHGWTLEDAGGLGLLAAVDRIDCGSATVGDAGTVFLDDSGMIAGRHFHAEGWLIPLGDEPFDRARSRAGGAASFRVTSGADGGAVPGMHALAGRVREGLTGAAAPLGPRGALLRGLAIGDTSGIDPRTEDLLRRSGLAHLLAVSGSNVAILLGVVAVALRNAPLAARVAGCAVALVLFVAVVGPDASVLRAAGMGAVALVALGSGRRAEPLHALGLALVAVVALRPGIVYSAGLHLSVAATLGIVLWAGPIAARLHRLPRPVAAALAATAAAQIAVTPLLAGVFGSVPVAGLPANLLAIPAVPPATVLALASGAIAPASAGAAAALAHAAAPFAGWILSVGEAFGEPAWASVSLPRVWGAVLAVPVAAAAARRIVTLSRPPRNLDP